MSSAEWSIAMLIFCIGGGPIVLGCAIEAIAEWITWMRP